MYSEFSHISTHDLVKYCQHETDQFFNGTPLDGKYCTELMRRALVEEEADAWHNVISIYSRLVRGWIRRQNIEALQDLTIADLEMMSFEKFWRSFNKASGCHFDDFSTLNQLLQYLRCCCSSVVCDALRAQQRRWQTAAIENRASQLISDENIEQKIIRKHCRREFWRKVDLLLTDELERFVVKCSFILALPPRDIYTKFPNKFSDVTEIYRIKRNAINRLQRIDPNYLEP